MRSMQCLCLVLSFAAAGAALSAEIRWTKVGNGSWGDPTVWDTPPVFDGTEDAFVGAAAASYGTTYTLDGDRHVNSLTLEGSFKTITAIGTPTTSRLILASGNVTKTSTAYHEMGPPIYLGDGASAVTGVWSIAGNTLTLCANAKIHGGPGSLIRIQGAANLSLLTDNSATYAGDWSVEGGNVFLGNDKALSGGTVALGNNAKLFVDTTRTIANTIVCSGGDAKFENNNYQTLTLSGPISGPGRIYPGKSNNYNWALKLTSPYISSTGGIDFNRTCAVVVCGTWTNCGDIAVRCSYGETSLQGNGTIGMASGKTLTTVSDTTLLLFPYIAPSDGTPAYAAPFTNTVGTLTLGTAGNTNSVTFGTRARYAVDVRPTGSDQLVVRGAVSINASETQLMLYGTLSGPLTYTLMEYDSLAGKFAKVFWNDVEIAAPEDKSSIGGTHTLVYGDTSLQLVGSSSKGTVLVVK
jgi:hypothetical protein